MDLIVRATKEGTMLAIKQTKHAEPVVVATLDFKSAILLSEQIKGSAFFVESQNNKLAAQAAAAEKGPVAP